MKKLISIVFALMMAISFSCTKKQDISKTETHIRSSGGVFTSNIVTDDDGTPYTISDNIAKTQWTAIYHDGAVPGTTRLLQKYFDSSSVHNYNGHVYWDSLAGSAELGNYTRLLTVGSDGRMGVSNKSTMATDFSAPTAGTAITSGTAFQPNSTAASYVLVNASLTGILGVNGTVTVATSATSGGTYTTVASDAIAIAVLGVGNKSMATVPVPKGYWVKVTLAGAATLSATRTTWSVQ